MGWKTTIVVVLLGCSGKDDGGPDADTDADTDVDTDTDADADTDADVPDTYTFDSRFEAGSSVSYSGQVMRHLLIADLAAHLDGLTSRLDTGAFFPVAGDVEAELDFYFSFDSATSGSVDLLSTTSPPAAQSRWDDVASDKDLVGKLAGNDAEGQHEDWSTAFVGWDQPGVTTPESLVRTWFAEIDAAAVARSNGDVPLDPTGAPLGAVHVSADGRDRRQLLQKFLLGAVAFSQGTDDYLDDDLPGSGLLADNAAAEEGEPFTPLEHAWDEGFGYYGAARDTLALGDEAAADPTYADLDGDGAIDLLSEVAWGHAQNAAKRDLGAVDPTDLSTDAFEAFVAGRHLITAADGPLDDAALDELRGHRDRAVEAWEAAVGATVVHYVNDTLKVMATFGTPAYDFGEHAKVWSELKGFALTPQFNPRSPLTAAEFERLHALLGTAPVLPDAPPAEVEGYRQALLDARELVGTAYGFDPANLGDEDGENGW